MMDGQIHQIHCKGSWVARLAFCRWFSLLLLFHLGYENGRLPPETFVPGIYIWPRGMNALVVLSSQALL